MMWLMLMISVGVIGMAYILYDFHRSMQSVLQEEVYPAEGSPTVTVDSTITYTHDLAVPKLVEEVNRHIDEILGSNPPASTAPVMHAYYVDGMNEIWIHCPATGTTYWDDGKGCTFITERSLTGHGVEYLGEV